MIDELPTLPRSAEGLRVFRAPGRVNLIGEHTDYNLGFVLPMGLDLATYVVTSPSVGGKLRICSEQRNHKRAWDIASIPDLKPEGRWYDYPIGVAVELHHAGFEIEPIDLFVRSTVPEGSGLSSSAAFEVSTALALLQGREIDPLELARLCQRAERDFVGMPCGIMDQYISVFGRQGQAVEIDCRSLEHRYVPLPDGVAFIAVNTMVKHALAGSAYKDRVAECAAAAAGLGVSSLRDVSVEQFHASSAVLPEIPGKRARHIVTENDRVNRFVAASAQGNVELMGGLLVESHRSLQCDYEVSCAELDFLVESALSVSGVLGARMTGGGFGGCTVNMMRADAVTRFLAEIVPAYQSRFGVVPQTYPCRPSAGACEIKFENIPPLN